MVKEKKKRKRKNPSKKEKINDSGQLKTEREKKELPHLKFNFFKALF